MRLLLSLTAFSVACSLCFAQPDEPMQGDPWPEVPAAESKLPDRDPAELMKRFESVLDEWRSLEAGRVRYTVRPEGKFGGTYGWAVFEPYEQTFAWDGNRWRLDWLRRLGEGEDAAEFRATVVRDGETMRALHEPPGRLVLVVHDLKEQGTIPHVVLWNVFPAVPNGLAETPVGRKLPGEGEFRLLEDRVRVDDRECYQFERFVDSEPQPSKTALPIDPNDPSKGFQLNDPSDPSKGYKIVDAVRKDRDLLRIAVDPERLLPVAWAIGSETRLAIEGRPPQGEPYRRLPTVAAHLKDFRPVGEAVMPWSVELTEYAWTTAGTKISNRTNLLVKDWMTEPPKDETFSVTVPDGTAVLDLVRRISYKTGAPQEEIDRLLAATARRDRYYETLKSQPLPELQGEWITSEPVRLADLKGKNVKLYLWGLGCAPCLAHLPTLEPLYGRDGSNTGEVFIAVHHHVDEESIKNVRKFVEEKGLTFPILVDAGGTFDDSPGALHEHFRVAAWPTQIQYDQEGRYLRSDIDRRVLSLQVPLEERWWGE